MNKEESLLCFPCDFSIKVMGVAAPDFRQNVVSWVRQHAADLDESRVEVRHSQAGRYQSVTVVVNAQDRIQLDAIYQDLSAQPSVKMVL